MAHDAVSYEHLNDTVTDVIDDIKDKHTLLNQEFNQHVQDQYNPHVVTKAQVGLGLADNTSDKDKPLSDASLEEFVEVRNELATEQARAEEQENLRIKKDSIQRSNITDKRTVVTAIHPQEITSGSVELIAHNSDVDDVDAWFETKMYLYATEHLFFEAADDGIIIKSDVEAVKATLQSELATAVATIEAEMATMNADFTSELATLGTDIRSEMATMEAELKSEIATLDAELSTEIATLAADIRSEIATLDAELSTEIATLATDIRSEMATLGADIRSEMATMEAELSTELATLEADLTAAIATEQARAEEQEELMIKKATIQRSNVTNKRTVVTAIHPQEITSDKVEFIAHNSDVENADS